MISFACPSCGKKLRAPESYAGRTGPCKKCGEPVRVPGGRETEVNTPPVKVESQPARSSAPTPPPRRRSTPPENRPTNPLIKRLLNDNQDPAVVERILVKVSQILMTREEVAYIAVQQRPVVNVVRDAAVLTNKRFILFHTNPLGGVNFDDYVWRDLHDCRIKEGLMGATISFRVEGSRQSLTIDYLPKTQAREVYRFAQDREEEALNERRTRSLEEMRAAAGGVVIQNAGNAASGSGQATPLEKLQQLKSMFDNNLISSEEFENKKAEILATM